MFSAGGVRSLERRPDARLRSWRVGSGNKPPGGTQIRRVQPVLGRRDERTSRLFLQRDVEAAGRGGVHHLLSRQASVVVPESRVRQELSRQSRRHPAGAHQSDLRRLSRRRGGGIVDHPGGRRTPDADADLLPHEAEKADEPSRHQMACRRPSWHLSRGSRAEWGSRSRILDRARPCL